MKVTRDVISDLLPLYLSGEASEDSRSLVEGYLEGDPEFARVARATPEEVLRDHRPPDLRGDHEMRALRRTKRLLRARGFLLPSAIFLSLLPFSVRGGAEGMRWLWSGQPLAVLVMAVAAVLSWAGYLLIRFRLRASDL